VDTNCKPKHDIPLWSETRWNGCFNPEEGVGVFLHLGRLRGHLDWWWAQTAVFLPGDRLAVERSWVRDPDERGVRTPSLDLYTEDPELWTARFDGIAQLTTSEELAKAPRGSSSPSVPVSFAVSGDSSRPRWDMYATHTDTEDWAGDMHWEQAGRAWGTLELPDERYRLDGVAFRDHSAGPRDWGRLGGHNFVVLLMPDFTLHAIDAFDRSGEQLPPIGAWLGHDGEQLGLDRLEMLEPGDIRATPPAFPLVVHPAGMEPQSFEVELYHAFPATVTERNENINGIDWDLPGDPYLVVEHYAKLIAADGSVGYAHVERGRRRQFTEQA
jgi:hypothetical protein